MFFPTLTLTLALSVPPAEWPQFLGPTRDSATTEIIAAWKEPPAVAWKQPVGDSHTLKATILRRVANPTA